MRKLVVQRTKLIDETQDMLLEMLEDMTTGSTAQWPGAGTLFLLEDGGRRLSTSEEGGQAALVLRAVKFQSWAQSV